MYGDGPIADGPIADFSFMFDEVARHLSAAIVAYKNGDPVWKEHVRYLARSAAKLERAVGRPQGSGSLRSADEPIVDKMYEIIKDNPVLTPSAVAARFTDEAAGHGCPESKIKRLAKRYRDKYC